MIHTSKIRRAGKKAHLAYLLLAATPLMAQQRHLRVCADPNNLPFSNQQGQGFENKIAELIAHEMHARLDYTWWLERRNFVRNTIDAHRCEVIFGMPASMDSALTTTPYYTSTYVFVYRKDRKVDVHSFDDPKLRMLRIGVHVLDDNYTPPAHALARRGITDLEGYSMYGEKTEKNAPAKIITAVAKGDIDVAMVWGPLAGYFAPRQTVPLAVVPVSPARDGVIPFTFAISAGVRKNDKPLGDEIDRILKSKRTEVRAILKSYGVPLVGNSEMAVARRGH